MTVSYLIIGLGLLIVIQRAGLGLSLWTAGIGHVVINLPLCFAIIYASMGAQQQNAERAARDLGAGEAQVVLLVTVPMLLPAILAAFFLAVTLSWDEFIIAFLLTRFDVTLPVEIWSMLRSGLSPRPTPSAASSSWSRSRPSSGWSSSFSDGSGDDRARHPRRRQPLVRRIPARSATSPSRSRRANT